MIVGHMETGWLQGADVHKQEFCLLYLFIKDLNINLPPHFKAFLAYKVNSIFSAIFSRHTHCVLQWQKHWFSLRLHRSPWPEGKIWGSWVQVLLSKGRHQRVLSFIPNSFCGLSLECSVTNYHTVNSSLNGFLHIYIPLLKTKPQAFHALLD